jgi:hypothetical protein
MEGGAPKERPIDLLIAMLELAALSFIAIVAADHDAARHWVSGLSRTTLQEIELYAFAASLVSATVALLLLLRRKARELPR